MSSKKGVKHKKTPREWTNIYEDLKVTKIKITKDNNQSVEKEVLLCKYCGIEFDYQNSHISTRLKEHINNCKSHDKLKNDFIKRQESGKQLTIEETHVRLKC
jgi:hypothetical protein